MDINNYSNRIFNIKSETEFNECAIDVFKFQYKFCVLYQKFVDGLGVNPDDIKDYFSVPFLPIDFFKTNKIISSLDNHEIVFESSGSTSDVKSKHYVTDTELYTKSLTKTFNLFFKNFNNNKLFCLVPSLVEKPSSSLAFMCNKLIEINKNVESGFYLNKTEKLKQNILDCERKKQKYILFGLSFEILNFSKKYRINIKNGVVIETGGTKKNQVRMIREELHSLIKKNFQLKDLVSEYGMAELLSQSYCFDGELFCSPPWKKILIRDKRNPLNIQRGSSRGCINIIDLSNINSCSFIATNDLGYKKDDKFCVTGRVLNTSQRGCNLLTQ